MTGIAGWYSERAARPAGESAAAAMAAALPGDGKLQESVFGGGTLAARLGEDSLASIGDAGIHVAIDGTPVWLQDDLRQIARDRGHGAALLAAYQSLGAELLQQLSGAFALAIVDAAKHRLLLAVDRMGTRPMCFATTDDGGVVFGSTASAVLASGRIDETLSPQSIYNYIYFHVVPSPSTVYENIRKLEPGQLLLLDAGSVSCSHFWSPAFSGHNDLDADALQKELVSVMRAAVGDATPAECGGAFLSGGLDSSTICGLASEFSDRPFPAFSIGFEQQGYDELEYARISTRHFGLDLHDYYVTPDDIAEAMPIIATAYDEPFGNSSAVPAYFCARLAKEAGIECLLAGDGGDELFAGNDRYVTQQIFEIYQRFPAAVRNAIFEPLIMHLPFAGTKLVHKARRYVEQARVPMPERLQTYNYLHMNDPSGVFDPEFMAGVEQQAPIRDMEAWYSRSAEFNLTDRMLMFDWKLTLADNDIRKVNRMCEAVGIDVAYPFLDDRLVEFSTTIPARLKIRNRELRYFFKKSFEDFLPHEVIHKQKHGFGLPFGEWLKTSDRLRDIVLPSLADLGARGIFRKEFIDDLLDNHQNVHAAYYGNIIWVLAMLEFWLAAQARRESSRVGTPHRPSN